MEGWMSRFGHILRVAGIVLLFFGHCGAAGGKVTKHGHEIKSFAVYYGEPRTKLLSTFDLAVIESASYTPEQIDLIKKNGTLVICYCTIGELDSHEAALFKNRKGWYMDGDKDGAPDRNANWDSFYANPADPQWRRFVLEKTQRTMNEKHCDGIFMDTVDTVDLYPKSADAMTGLVRSIRDANPGAFIISNRGFAIMEGIAPFIDGVLFECFSTDYDFEKKHYRRFDIDDMKYNHIIYENKLKAFIKRGGLVFSLDYALPDQKNLINFAWTRAMDYGFIPSISQVELNKVSNITGRFIPDIQRQFGKDALARNKP